VDFLRLHFDLGGFCDCGGWGVSDVIEALSEYKYLLESMGHDAQSTGPYMRCLDAIASLQAVQGEVVPTGLDEAIKAGDGVLMSEQAALLRECRSALDDLIKKKPGIEALICGSTTLGNLRASLYDYRPQGVLGGVKNEQ